ncbi:MAG: type II toxin-antitoxin system HicA family toxin [Clostridiales bacterium]|nr:type II toxin-antitoxin system HicA family toxin [Clostridiales bacterium]MBP3809857.1 type II toxin-antitoxin system HicA family toxin [Clostridiales bacterium]
MKTSELKRLLKKNGCYRHRSGANHDIWFSPITSKEFAVPRHDSHKVRTGTLRAILKDAGLDSRTDKEH